MSCSPRFAADGDCARVDGGCRVRPPAPLPVVELEDAAVVALEPAVAPVDEGAVDDVVAVEGGVEGEEADDATEAATSAILLLIDSK